MKNNIILSVVLVVLLVCFIVLNITIFRFKKKIKSLMGLYYMTVHNISEYGYLIGIYGPVGVGKTSYTSGLSHAFQSIFIQKIHKVIKETKIIFNNINFKEFNNLLYQVLQQDPNKQINFDNVTKVMMYHFKLFEFPIFTYTGHKTVYEVIKDYCIAFQALIRNNFVMSKTRFYSHATGHYNYEYNIRNQEILSLNNDYSIYDYLIEIQDESSDDNSKYMWQEKIDKGSKEYKSKIRHIHRETNRMIIIRQDSTDEVKAERDLLQTNIEVKGKRLINPYEWIFNHIKKLYYYPKRMNRFFKYKIPYFLKKLKTIITERRIMNFNEYISKIYDEPNDYRNIDKKVKWLEYFFLFNSFLEYEIEIKDKVDDVKKSNASTEKMYQYFPVYMCYAYPRFEYDGIQDKLMSQSNYVAKEVNVFNKPDFFKDKKVIKKDTAESEVIERVNI